jgi:fructuronate reductase
MEETTASSVPSSTAVNGTQPQGKAQVAHSQLVIERLAALPSHVKKPAYDPATLSLGIVHFGAGNFVLAHLGSYINDILNVDPTWGICAASIRTDGIISALRKQGNLYALIEREGDHRQASMMAPVVESIFAPEDPKRLVERVADARVRLVTFTVSNKGYFVTSPTSQLDVAHPDIVHDLALPDGATPKSIYWYLVRGLEERRKSHGSPVTLLSLDNIPQNSRTLQNGLMQFVRKAGMEELAAWIEKNVAFPVSTVDRITPETSADVRRDASTILGFDSPVVVATEGFRQFVVERSPHPMPPWDKAGVRVVKDCSLSWELKFFCLNGAHQVPAILGQRLGLRYIHEATRNKKIAQVLKLAHAEYGSVIPIHAGKVHLYGGKIRRRFADSALADTIERVGARATSKVSERLLACVERGLAASGHVLIAPTIVTACWLLNLGGEDEFGQSISLNDPDAPKLLDLHEEVHNWVRCVGAAGASQESIATAPLASALARIGQAVGDDRFVRLSKVDCFIRELAWALVQIHTLGLEHAITALLERYV